ncbi:cobalamin biosynthesis protein CobD [Rubidibacter lacunae KORDI 51-2]|uniref:Cobalamin biosynthesis protein CobD n=1 Tax=Rubidibacter lacunae KORDI 51-2 TaxID=582515 RepID=U5DNE1_9CHRO|nr:adenosylcobinamide-phosphate synthase CbiB [Rubidibacter lacunae]ERN43181.1 cobalamin biosynthesis protein CobD [Rubidibacter lacunae KORDI 51-2]
MHDAIAAAVILVGAAGLDFCLGDPQQWLHPVQVMGVTIAGGTRAILATCPGGSLQRLAGVLMGVCTIIGSGLVGWGAVRLAGVLHPSLAIAVEIVLLASCFALRTLRRAAGEVLEPLAAGDLPAARSQLSRYVGRDTADLDEPEILRAVLETVAENTTDGVTAPLFYGIVGMALPGVTGPALALAYKGASTLDSMVGYRYEPYRDLGWFSARFEDVLTWLPCRLTVLTIAMLGGRPRAVWQLCRRDAALDPSPNAGWSECAFAASLGVQLGGTNYYQGAATFKPRLGEPERAIAPETIERALDLARNCFLLWLGLAVAGAGVAASIQ